MSSQSPDRKRLAVRADIAIAICALLVSALATTASWWQTRVIADQLSAQVWPYITFTGTVADDRIDLDVANDGLGPAIVKSFVLRVDGKPQHDMRAALHALVGRIRMRNGRTVATDLTLSTLSAGEVLRPASSRTFFHMSRNVVAVAALSKQLDRIAMDVCYCSIVANCWSVTFPGATPVVRATCSHSGADQLHDVPLTTPGVDTY